MFVVWVLKASRSTSCTNSACFSIGTRFCSLDWNREISLESRVIYPRWQIVSHSSKADGASPCELPRDISIFSAILHSEEPKQVSRSGQKKALKHCHYNRFHAPWQRILSAWMKRLSSSCWILSTSCLWTSELPVPTYTFTSSARKDFQFQFLNLLWYTHNESVVASKFKWK